MCKPDLTITGDSEAVRQSQDFLSWQDAMKQYSAVPGVYMKLSGAFSQLGSGKVDTYSAAEIADRIQPWTDTIFECFGSSRIMFGSDWPVCNISGPAGEESWSAWWEVVSEVLKRRELDGSALDRVLSGTASEAYRLSN